MRTTTHRVIILVVAILLSPSVLGDVVRWDFESDLDLREWVPNSHLSNVVIEDGVLRAAAIDWDPFLLCRSTAIEATAYQYVVIRLRADGPGIGELFWSGELEGQYGGLTERKKVRFSVEGDDRWQEIVVFPFWHTERVVRQLRLDLYQGAHFEIDWVCVRDWGGGRSPNAFGVWGLGGDVAGWQIHPGALNLFAPPVRIDVSDKTWVTVQLKSDRPGVAAVLWALEDAPGVQSEDFSILGDGKLHAYNLRIADNPAWRGRILAFGIRLPAEAKAWLESVRLGKEPSGPGEIEFCYFGFEDGTNRVGRPCRLLAQVVNRGGGPQGVRGVHLILPEAVQLVSEPAKLYHPGLEHGEIARFTWEIAAAKAGSYRVGLLFSGKGSLPPQQTVSLQFTEPVDRPAADYVPPPRPVKTAVDICAFYFPGWDTAQKWDCVRDVAPYRKPLLGYYDESNPECVDWQIKWAVENGISCFLVDWYWVEGRRQLTHWFEAYQRARYRDFLKVAIMWANHNPPNTHSVDDLLSVTRHWIEEYFPLKSYYHIDGKPAVFIWSPRGIRADLGSVETVRETLRRSQALAREAGYEGITFVAMGNDFSGTGVQALLEEGYAGITTYHEWGSTVDGAVSTKLFDFRDVVRESTAAWRRKNRAAGSLHYYPLVDTGWDSRPWHGDKAMVIQGRTPQLFEELLWQGRSFCVENDKPILVLGPVNEWGEGSYIEPCTEFGFEMLEAVRRVFANGDAADWPANTAPQDVGRGPYDFPLPDPHD
ncbi:MAG TPA: hypothetical protein ENN81_10910 [Phycisphaerales bacterium]|nr:hypothetical protein [Phycisphaerales bacterium]